MPSEIQCAWAAGIVDADGCVTMRPPSGGRYRHPYVVVDSTDPEILQEFVDLFGGKLVPKKRRKESWRPQWSWRVYGARNVLAFLQEIAPYMHCPSKVARTRLLLEEYPLVTQRNGQYTEEQRAAKLDFEERVMNIGYGRGASLRRKWASSSAGSSGTLIQ